MVRNKRLLTVLLIILVEFLLLGILIVDNYQILRRGDAVWVEVNRDQPISILNSTSIRYNCVGLEISTPTLPESSTLKEGDKIYAVYKVNGRGMLRLDRYYLTAQEVPENEDFLEVRLVSIETVTVPPSTPQGTATSQYILHVEAPFSEQSYSPVILSRLREFLEDPDREQGQLALQIRVDHGKSALEMLVLDGEPVRELLSEDGQ
ncbi:MAG: hypothetical protein ACOX7F_07775 [Eubacteriales bacterium]|jgi:hypothetical protein